MNTQHAIRIFTLVTLCLAALPTGSSHAATFQVYPSSSISDRHDDVPGDGFSLSSDGISTLRTAIEEANALPGPDRIVLNVSCGAPSYNQVTALSLGPMDIVEDLEIIGVTCSDAAKVDWLVQSNTITVKPGIRLFISGVHFFFAFYEDVGFHVQENATFEVRILPETHAGFGIYLNRAKGTDIAGAILNDGGTVDIQDGIFRVNGFSGAGAAISSINGTLDIRGTLFSENRAYLQGGAIYIDGGTATIENSVIRRSTATKGGAVYLKSGTLNVSNTTFGENESYDIGGALYVESGTLNLINVTIARNQAGSTKNSVNIEGEGEIVPQGTAGLFIAPGATVRMGNTLIAENIGPTSTPDICGSVTSLGNNLVSIADSVTGLESIGDMSGTSDTPFDAMLEEFESLDVFTLAGESPAIDAGNTSLLLDTKYVSTPPVSDARDYIFFSRLRGLSVDIGSYERQSALPVHTADQDGDLDISLSEVLRVIQFFNSAGYACAEPPESTEDGFTPNPPGQRFCVPHSSDYDFLDWTINLSELLRTIQFYNSGGYTFCPNDDTEDGYCPAG